MVQLSAGDIDLDQQICVGDHCWILMTTNLAGFSGARFGFAEWQIMESAVPVVNLIRLAIG
jgi:hypothetical protein